MSHISSSYAVKMIWRCVIEEEIPDILHHFHSSDYGGHFESQRTTMKVLQSGFYWPNLFKDANTFVK